MHTETKRLIITELTIEMVRDVHENSLDRDNRRFVPDEVFETPEEARETVEFLISRYGTAEGPFVYAVLAKDGMRNIGYVQLAMIEDGKWEVGYHIGEKYTGRGYATEAVRAFLPAITGALGIREIYGICLKENAASVRVLAKCGFKTLFTGMGPYQGEEREIVRSVWKAEPERMAVNGEEYRIIRLLGHGKGGYSYLAERDGKQAVLKQIHHEPCDYYSFGNKIEAEKRDYERLRQAGIRIPQMIAVDEEAERIVKEYIPGQTVFDLVRDGGSAEPYLSQAREMADKAKAAGINIDYFPTNFVICDGLIWYVDYECNDYMEEWDFEHWGIRYWSRTSEFEAYIHRTV